MRKKHYLLAGLSAISLCLASCIDNDYDLSNIDTTSRLQVKDLIVPINIDDITLSQVLDLDDDSEIEEVVQPDGSVIYAVRKEGDFKSDPVNIASFTSSKPTINPIVSTLDLQDLRNAAAVTGGLTAYYDISCDPTPFKSEARNVDKSIVAIKELGVKTVFTNKITISGLDASTLEHTLVEGLVIQFPKGLKGTSSAGKYDSTTGLLTFSNGETLKPNTKGEMSVTLNVTGIDATQKNIMFNSNTHQFVYEDEISVLKGRVNIYADRTLPAHIKFHLVPSIDAIKVEQFSGKIEHEVDNVNINPIEIKSLPDLLSQEGTSITIANPQLFLSLNNPLRNYMPAGEVMDLESRFELTSIRNNENAKYILDKLTTNKDNINNQYVLSPKQPSHYVEGYDNPQWVEFATLGNVLDVNGHGIPTKIDVDVIDPVIRETDIEKLQLGSDLSPVEGKYTFYAPLQLNDASTIKYSDIIDGWNDEDVDKMTINKLFVRFEATTEVPFEGELKVLPVDKSGDVIQGVTSNTVNLDSNAQGQLVEVTIDGTIQHLDGIRLDVRLKNVGSNTALAPEMKIFVENLKATVTGYYEDEF